MSSSHKGETMRRGPRGPRRDIVVRVSLSESEHRNVVNLAKHFNMSISDTLRALIKGERLVDHYIQDKSPPQYDAENDNPRHCKERPAPRLQTTCFTGGKK